jgi:hypothetical protein
MGTDRRLLGRQRATALEPPLFILQISTLLLQSILHFLVASIKFFL